MPRSISHTPKSGTSLTFRGNKSRHHQVLKMSAANVSRLAGGADSPEAAEEAQKNDENEEQESKSDMKAKSEAGTTSAASSKVPSNASKVPSNGGEETTESMVQNEEDEQVKKFPSLEAVLTGDKRIDDLIEYVQKNLREACEALVGMGDNIEHEIKLMFVDVIARIRRWVNSTEDKLEKTLTETRNLAIEFKTKMDSLANCENDMEALRTQLAAAEAAAASAASGHHKKKDHHHHKGEDPSGEEAPDGKSEDLTPSGRRRESGEDVPRESSSSDSRAVSRASSRVDTRMINAELAQSQRETELQKEVECLRKENERLIKERTEYENAVQRAILKGVSSLNVEALKVMRNPPATCYDPCGQSSSLIEPPMVPCGPRMSDNFPGSMSNYSENQPRKSQGKKTCTNVNCPSAKNRKRSLAQSLLLLNERNTHC